MPTLASVEKLEAEANGAQIQVLQRSRVRKNHLDRKNRREERAWQGEADGDLPACVPRAGVGGRPPTECLAARPASNAGPPPARREPPSEVVSHWSP